MKEKGIILNVFVVGGLSTDLKDRKSFLENGK
jgi:hypothetical protein